MAGLRPLGRLGTWPCWALAEPRSAASLPLRVTCGGIEAAHDRQLCLRDQSRGCDPRLPRLVPPIEPADRPGPVSVVAAGKVAGSDRASPVPGTSAASRWWSFAREDRTTCDAF